MERLLEDLAERALLEPRWRKLLQAVVNRELKLTELLEANVRNRLETLLLNLHDPLLPDAISEFYEAKKVERQVVYGFDKVKDYVPASSRLSFLTDPAVINEMCRSYEREELKQNTVRRQVYRATSLLLTHYYGVAERDRIFASVDFAAEDDVREVLISPQEIDHLFEACDKFGYGELATVIRLALLSSADRGVILAGRSADGEKRGLRRRRSTRSAQRFHRRSRFE